MNQVFDIKRFAKLIVHDLKRLSPQYSLAGSSLISLLIFSPAMVLISNFSESGVHGPSYRLLLIVLMSLSAGLMIHWYDGYINTKHKQNFYHRPLLPASKCEKYWASVLMTLIIIPILELIANLIIDLLFSCIGLPGYHHFIWEASLISELNASLVAAVFLPFLWAVFTQIYIAQYKKKKGFSTISFCSFLVTMAVIVVFAIQCIDENYKVLTIGLAIVSALAVASAFGSWNASKKTTY